MQPIRLAGVLAAFALTLVGSAVVAQQSGTPRAEGPAQAKQAWPAALDGLRGLAEYFSGDRADSPLRTLPSFEAYADDEPEPRRGGDRGEAEDRGRRGGTREEGPDRQRGHGGGGPRGEMMAPRAHGGLCGPYGDRMVGMMLTRLERMANPTESQRAAFEKLKEAATKAGETARAGCPAERPFTPLGRLAAAEKRMEAMLAAIRLVRPPLEEFFALLSEEQKARVYASGPRHHPPAGRRDWRERPRDGDGPRRDRWRDGRRDGWPDPWRGRL